MEESVVNCPRRWELLKSSRRVWGLAHCATSGVARMTKSASLHGQWECGSLASGPVHPNRATPVTV